MKHTVSWSLVLANLLPLCGSCGGNAPTVRALFDRYSQASAAHDLETLASLTAEHVVWELGPYRLEGKEEALGPNRYDAGTRTVLTFQDVRVDGNVVECELIEANEIIHAIGMSEIRHYPRFEFDNGLVARKSGPWKEVPHAYSMAEFNKRMAPFRQWMRTAHPSAIVKLLDDDRNFRFTQANGELMLALAREWVDAGAPGRLPVN